MQYHGPLFGNIRGTRKYFDTGKTSADWDALEKRAEDAESNVTKLREALAFIVKHGGMTHDTECGEIQCTGSWCAEQARAALAQAEDNK